MSDLEASITVWGVVIAFVALALFIGGLLFLVWALGLFLRPLVG